jgi:integral membrane sensor domain MASE1
VIGAVAFPQARRTARAKAVGFIVNEGHLLVEVRSTGWGAWATRVAGSLRRWVGPVVLAIAVAIAYSLAAQLSFFLRTKPDDIAAFWPAAGVGAGILIGLGPRARLPVAVGTVVASVLSNLSGNWSLSTSLVFALCNAGQVLLIAGLIQHYFGEAFTLDSLRRVLGLVAAAIVGTAAGATG